jgi:hypothetical protein
MARSSASERDLPETWKEGRAGLMPRARREQAAFLLLEGDVRAAGASGAFLEEDRHELFDEPFQAELARAYVNARRAAAGVADPAGAGHGPAGLSSCQHQHNDYVTGTAGAERVSSAFALGNRHDREGQLHPAPRLLACQMTASSGAESAAVVAVVAKLAVEAGQQDRRRRKPGRYQASKSGRRRSARAA